MGFLRHTHWMYHLGRPARASVQTLPCKIRAVQTRVMQTRVMQSRVRQIRTVLVKIQSWPMDPVTGVPQLLSVRDVKVREIVGEVLTDQACGPKFSFPAPTYIKIQAWKPGTVIVAW